MIALKNTLTWWTPSRTTLTFFTVSRLMLFFIAWAGQWVHGHWGNMDTLLCQFDCGWYQGIIDNHYDQMPRDPIPEAHPFGVANWAFFPLFPMAAKAFAWLVGSFWSSVVINNLAFLATLHLLEKFCQTHFNQELGKIISALCAFSPFSLYFSIPYSEALFGLLAVAFFYQLYQKNFLWAGVCVAILSASRAIGVFALIPLLIAIGYHLKNKHHQTIDDYLKCSLALLIAPLGLALFMLFLHQVSGDALAFSNIQIAWGRTPENPIGRLVYGLGIGGLERYYALSALAGLAMAAYLILTLEHVGMGVFLIIAILVPASTALYSLPRYTWALFMPYLAISMIMQRFKVPLLPVLALFASLFGMYVLAWTKGGVGFVI